MAVSDHLFELRERLEKYQRTRDEILSNGQNHALTGSHAVEYPRIQYIDKEIRRLEGQIMRLNGAKDHTYPSYTADEEL